MQDNKGLVDLTDMKNPIINGCARCGEDHPVTYRKFKKSNVPGYHMWAMCPVLDEPIMITIIKDGNEES